MSRSEESPPLDFIRQIVAADLVSGKYGGRVVTRFPPEPNGFLHIGHAKSICLNFGVAAEHPGGRCNLRFDDTNPLKEEDLYLQSIRTDVRWLGFDWEERQFYASGYFERLYQLAERLIENGHAYVCSLSAEELRHSRGTLTQPGRESPYRTRSVAVSLDLFRRMRAGEFPDGTHILRARIDMASPNMNMRDPALYRILHANHHQTGDQWCLYPTYDYAHCLCDAMEGITHSLCTLEFEDHRPLYDWILDRLQAELTYRPQQIEFSRLTLEYTVVSKRKLNTLVKSGVVDGWDDPRMPTLSGLRRRGYTPAAIRDFCQRVGISKTPNNVELALLENCLREDLDKHAPRAMAVLDPLRVVITSVAADHVEALTAANHPQNAAMGSRTLFWTREIWIEREDFCENPPKQFKRLVPGGEVRLRHAYVVRCDAVIKDPASGAILELHCSHDPATLHANPVDRKVKGVIHWVSATRSCRAEVRHYETLFTTPNPDEAWQGDDFAALINPNSLQVLSNCHIEEGLRDAPPGSIFQFERLGYFCVDAGCAAGAERVFNRTVGLRDSWAKVQQGR
ncbi:MAG: glutamine--tRNA ligase/YqeY domain fusion protein [Magnetococcales bacterium]|nr:glutamine--tRNA ligase/YqeY domain fusion protein [Magnetococcales bacterium]